MRNKNIVTKIYRDSEVKRVSEKITMLNNYPINEIKFLNIRLGTTILTFIITLLIFKTGYILSPAIAIVYYYLFEYIFLDVLIQNRTKKLDREALTFFEILTLTLESGRDLEKASYFPFMSLHAHSSGFDITFESKVEGYRASALIRSYELVDMQDGKFLRWDTKKRMFVKSDKYCCNIQSTYLYALLNGFSLGNENDIRWIDEPREQTKIIIQKPRQNVFQSMSEWEYIKIKGKRCKREWSFTRDDRI